MSKIIKVLGVLLSLCLFSGCEELFYEDEYVDGRYENMKNEEALVLEATKKIRIKWEEKEIIIGLEDSQASQFFFEQLPLTLQFEDYHQTEKISYLSKKLEISNSPENGIDPQIGDFAYYAPWGNLAIFYEDFGYSKSLVKLGTVLSGEEYLFSLDQKTVTIEKIEDQ